MISSILWYGIGTYYAIGTCVVIYLAGDMYIKERVKCKTDSPAIEMQSL